MLHIDNNRTALEEAEAIFDEQIGFKHLSSSSIKDASECIQKFVYRGRYRPYSIQMECGNIIHDMYRSMCIKIRGYLKDNPMTGLKDAARAVIRNVNIQSTFVEIAMESYNSAQVGALPILYKPSEKDICLNQNTLCEFYKRLSQYINEDLFLDLLSDQVSDAIEVDAFWVCPINVGERRYDVVLVGRIDEILSLDNDWVISDIKTSWSSRSDPVNSDHTKFQLWLYKKMLEDHLEKLSLHAHKIKLEVKWVKSMLPKDLSQIDKKGVTFTVTKHPIEILNADEYRYNMKIKSLLVNLVYGCGQIANSKYGCKYCQYYEICEYKTAEESDV